MPRTSKVMRNKIQILFVSEKFKWYENGLDESGSYSGVLSSYSSSSSTTSYSQYWSLFAISCQKRGINIYINIANRANRVEYNSSSCHRNIPLHSWLNNGSCLETSEQTWQQSWWKGYLNRQLGEASETLIYIIS